MLSDGNIPATADAPAARPGPGTISATSAARMHSWSLPGNLDTLRYERKFTCDYGRHHVESLVRLHPALFKEIYHHRWVNNIYFDTRRLDSYEDNMDGESRRRLKVRIRWYGDLLGRIEQPALELKIKRGMVNWKERFPLAPFSLGDTAPVGDIRDYLKNNGLPEFLVQSLQTLRPALVNRYSRRYFQTPDRSFRLTIDSELEFHAIHAGHLRAAGDSAGVAHVILELKYELDRSEAAADITQHFPLRVVRSSKYAIGIGRLREHSFQPG